MIRVLWYLVILIASVIIGILIARDPGYVLIAYMQETVEMPLWVLALGILAFSASVHLLLRAINFTLALPRVLAEWWQDRKNRKNAALLHQGLLSWWGGQWQVAEREFIKASPIADSLGINLFLAATTAEEQGAVQRRDTYLAQAVAVNPKLQTVCELFKAKMDMRAKQWRSAATRLERLRLTHPKEATVLALLQQCYLLLQDWTQCWQLLGTLKKYAVMTGTEFSEFEQATYRGLLQQAAATKSWNVMAETWANVPRSRRIDLQLLYAYAEGMIACGKEGEAQALVERTLKKQWDDGLAELLSRLASPAADKTLNMLEAWLIDLPAHGVLLKALGRMALQAKLWGKARNYWEQNLAIAWDAETALLLIRLLEQIGETEMARHYLEQLALSESPLPLWGRARERA
jgi:HemY protein